MSFAEDEYEDDDDDDLLFQHCSSDLQALRDVCHIYGYDDDNDDTYDDDIGDAGGEDGCDRVNVCRKEGKDRLPHSSVVDDDIDFDEDAFLLRTIQKRVGATVSTASSYSSSKEVCKVSTEPLASRHLEEEDDDAILQAVRQRFGSSVVPAVSTGKVKKLLPKENKRHCFSANHKDTKNLKSISGEAANQGEDCMTTEEKEHPFSMAKDDLLKTADKVERYALSHNKGSSLSIAKDDLLKTADKVEKYALSHNKGSSLSIAKNGSLKAPEKGNRHVFQDKEPPLTLAKDEINPKNISVEAFSTSELSTELFHSHISPEAKEEPTAFAFPGQAEIFDDNLEGFSDESVDGVVLNNNNILEESSAELQGKSMRNTLNALKKNRLLQKILTKKLELIQSKLQENAGLKKQVRALIEFQNITSRSAEQSGNTVSTADYSTTGGKSKLINLDVDLVRIRPPPNMDVAKLKVVLRDYSCEGVPKAWTKLEKDELLKGLKQQIQESRMRSAMEIFNDESNDMTILDGQLKAISEQELTAHEIRAALPLVNWEEVARMYVVKRTPIECLIKWMNDEDPLIDHGPWTKAEDKRLWSIARNNKLSNWDKIAEELGGHRSVAQCLIRYQRSLNAGIVRSAWTAQEDEQLRAAVQIYGSKDWPAVAATLECRTSAQCWNRWSKTLNPVRKKTGKWDIIEDKQLKIAVSVYGPRNWKMIASHVPGRTDVQCRERWCNVLDPSLSNEGWTKEEDEKLNQAIIKHGFRWSAVSNYLKPRTDNQCWRRWKLLHPDDVLELQKNNKIQKIALVSNFVGRRKERPTLQPSDFIPQGTVYLEDNQVKPKRKRTRTFKSNPQNNGTKAYMRFLREVANISHNRGNTQSDAIKGQLMNGDQNCSTAKVSSVRNDEMQPFADISEPDNITSKEGKLMDVDKDSGKRTEKLELNAQITEPNKTLDEMDKMQNDEVEAAVKALFSWPFLWGLQDLWRRQEQDD